jgi:hypothetical protein
MRDLATSCIEKTLRQLRQRRFIHVIVQAVYEPILKDFSFLFYFGEISHTAIISRQSDALFR